MLSNSLYNTVKTHYVKVYGVAVHIFVCMYLYATLLYRALTSFYLNYCFIFNI